MVCVLHGVVLCVLHGVVLCLTWCCVAVFSCGLPLCSSTQTCCPALQSGKGYFMVVDFNYYLGLKLHLNTSTIIHF